MKSIKGLKSLKGKIVLLRADYNVPMDNGKVRDEMRIKASFETIDYLRKKGAGVVIVSHEGDGSTSLFPVVKVLQKKYKVFFTEEVPTEKPSLKSGEILLIENIRRYEGEEKNDKNFAKSLAKIADVYVNEAFPVSHRAHASVNSITRYLPSYAGFQLEREVKHMNELLHKHKHPFLVIIGGAKFSTKLPLINKFLKIADYVFVGGALANNLLKDAGFPVGKSMVEKGYDFTKVLKSNKLLLPSDVTVNRNGKIENVYIEDVRDSDTIIDSGKETMSALGKIVSESKMVLWNGPLGKYEERGGKEATLHVLKALAKNAKCYSVIGGGDITAVSTPAIEKKLSFVSTGGGATLEYLSKGTLPGITVLK